MHSDTATRGQEMIYCRKCGEPVVFCMCYLLLDKKPDVIEAPKKILANIHNDKHSAFIFKKNMRKMHSLSGMKGVNLLKKLDKR